MNAGIDCPSCHGPMLRLPNVSLRTHYYLCKNTQCRKQFSEEEIEKDYPDITDIIKERQQKEKERQQKEKERQQKEKERRLEDQRIQVLEKEKEDAARLTLLEKLHSYVEANEGDLSRLSYLQINALVENMQEFSGLAESLNPEEYAVREKLYKVAFFDRNLQAGLQAQYAASQAQYAASQAQHAEEQAKEATVQTELLNKLNIAVGNKPSGSAAKGSNAAKNVALLGGAAALMKLNQISQDVNEISEDTSDLSEGFGGF
jgi:hypothetical protein